MNEDVKKVLQKAFDCLDDSKYLLRDGRLEAACNRAYYGVFDAIQAALINENISTKSHQGSHIKFREMFIKTSILPDKLNNTITNSFNLRQGGDYDSDFEISEQDVKLILDDAILFVNTVRDYLINLETV